MGVDMTPLLCYDASNHQLLEVISVSKRHLRPVENQAKVKVARHAHNTDLSSVWFGALAVFFAGVFYFWAYYFWGDWWRVLTGG
jgi:hypothetical protein